MNAISKAESFICVPYDEIKKTENFHQTLKPNEIYVYSKQVSLENQSLCPINCRQITGSRRSHARRNPVSTVARLDSIDPEHHFPHRQIHAREISTKRQDRKIAFLY